MIQNSLDSLKAGRGMPSKVLDDTILGKMGFPAAGTPGLWGRELERGLANSMNRSCGPWHQELSGSGDGRGGEGAPWRGSQTFLQVGALAM